ncbi:hypothetical protein UB31_21090 [Bradyrhizobium sp. LTSP849]|uniref:hypothetical protein n=1 Tax=Bradyrhizobium sp. LTSP849 TaxID=1615890 RepID=UPI0005DCF930|nr:hypothetical protein [Bradyrhizobium sp. LTSP849]KJC45193.1 hypothetical protein UB31_21090 [Bradyrhizobium sp. LTSP849]
MIANLKSFFMLLAVTCLAVSVVPGQGSALTADLARKCSALTAKQFPAREPGNPAAGSSKGSGRVQHDYFNKCVANNGNMDVGTQSK